LIINVRQVTRSGDRRTWVRPSRDPELSDEIRVFTKKAVMMSVLARVGERDVFEELSHFRTDFYGCLSARADAFFELADALLCADGPVKTPVELSLTAEHRRGYGSLYAALNHGRLDVERLRDLLVSVPLPRFEGRIVLSVDVSPWLRSDAACSPERLFCHVHGRSRAAAQIIPGWPYSVIASLSPGPSSWTAVLDAVRLGPEDDATAVTAIQLRAVVERLVRADKWRTGDQEMLVVMDAGYDVTRLAWLLRDLPVELVGRLRSDRVLRVPPRPLSFTYQPLGRPRKHGLELRLAKPETWPEPALVTVNDTDRYGKAHTQAWDRVHPRLRPFLHRSAPDREALCGGRLGRGVRISGGGGGECAPVLYSKSRRWRTGSARACCG
jgi:hypothetical protein